MRIAAVRATARGFVQLALGLSRPPRPGPPDGLAFDFDLVRRLFEGGFYRAPVGSRNTGTAYLSIWRSAASASGLDARYSLYSGRSRTDFRTAT